MKKCMEVNNDIDPTLLKIRSAPVGLGLPSPTTLVLNRVIKGLIPRINDAN